MYSHNFDANICDLNVSIDCHKWKYKTERNMEAEMVEWHLTSENAQ